MIAPLASITRYNIPDLDYGGDWVKYADLLAWEGQIRALVEQWRDNADVVKPEMLQAYCALRSCADDLDDLLSAASKEKP